MSGRAAIVLLGLASVAHAQPLSLELRSATTVGSTAIDQNGVSFAVTGLSGLAWRGPSAPDQYLAVMDNSNKIVSLRIVLDAQGSIVSAAIAGAAAGGFHGGGISLSETRDFEDIVFTGEANATVWLSEEGVPQLREYALETGALVRVATTPPIFLNRRSNFGFESLSASRSQSRLWTANEEALTVDGALSTASAGTLVRLLAYDLTGPTPAPVAQYAYLTQPLHGSAISGSRSGVSQVVTLGNGRLLTLERSLALAATFFQTRIYETDVAGATDVSSVSSLTAAPVVRASKRLLYQGDQTNLEGLCLGPMLAGGGRAVIGIVDDADPISVNRVVAFRLLGTEASACPADLNDDGVVDNADFVRFAQSYNLLLDPVGDLDFDGLCDASDFVLFASAYNDFVCPA